MKVDFVVVACSRDLELLKLQARSIGRFLDPELVNQIIVIINDPDPAFAGQVYSIKKEYGPIQDCVVILDYTAVVGPSDLEFNGTYYSARNWESSQVARLLVSRIITTDWYINIDCKNIFTGPIDYSTFFVNEQAKVVGHVNTDDTIKNTEHSWWESSCKYFNFDGSLINPIRCYSPIVFRTQFVQHLISSNKNNTSLAYNLIDSLYTRSYPLADVSLYSAWVWNQNLYQSYYCNELIVRGSILEYGPDNPYCYIYEIHRLRDMSEILQNKEKQNITKQCLIEDTGLFTDAEWNNFLLSFELEKTN